MKDIDIRNSLKKHFLDSNSVIIDEFNVSLGIVRADIAVINGVLHGFEIKSDQDTLLRLENQITEYNKFFEYVTIVSGEKFLSKIVDSVPKKCGIIVAKNINDRVILKHLRKAKRNYNIDKICLAKSLWKDEIIEILEESKYKKGFKSKSKPFLYEILAKEFSKKELLNLVKDKIKHRTNWRTGSQHIQNDDYFQLSSMS